MIFVRSWTFEEMVVALGDIWRWGSSGVTFSSGQTPPPLFETYQVVSTERIKAANCLSGAREMKGLLAKTSNSSHYWTSLSRQALLWVFRPKKLCLVERPDPLNMKGSGLSW